MLETSEWDASRTDALLTKLGGSSVAMRIVGCREVKVIFLPNGKVVISVDPPELKVWRTVDLGTNLTNAGDFRKALHDANCRISDWANDILGDKEFAVAGEKTTLKLIVLSVAELGFIDGAQFKGICARAKALGFELCPAEVGPQVRLQYLDQPKDEWLSIAMNGIYGSYESPLSFIIGQNEYDQLSLEVNCGSPEDFWSANYRFVFVLPEPQIPCAY